MAFSSDNIVTAGLSGALGRQLVFRQLHGRTVVCKFPDMSRVVYNEAQKAEQSRFRQAVAWARSILADPQKKAAFRLKKGQRSVYHAAISHYLLTSKKAGQQPAETPVAGTLTRKPVLRPEKRPVPLTNDRPVHRITHSIIPADPVPR